MDSALHLKRITYLTLNGPEKSSVQINKLLGAIYYNGGSYETQRLTCVSVASIQHSDSLAGCLLVFLVYNPDVGKIPADYTVSHLNYH
jgi:hypothetical protein